MEVFDDGEVRVRVPVQQNADHEVDDEISYLTCRSKHLKDLKEQQQAVAASNDDVVSPSLNAQGPVGAAVTRRSGPVAKLEKFDFWCNIAIMLGTIVGMKTIVVFICKTVLKELPQR